VQSNLAVLPVLFSPLEQFEMIAVGSISNVVLFWIISVLIWAWAAPYRTVSQPIYFIPNLLLHLVFALTEQLVILIKRNLGGLIGQSYVMWLLFSFFVVCVNNLVGMIPYSFTTTSHIVMTFTIAWIFFAAINLRAVATNPRTFFKLFVPGRAPLMIMPFLVIIEIVSYLARTFSLSIRLFANMTAGHTLLKILIGFVFLLLSESFLTSWVFVFTAAVAFALVVLITLLEVCIAGLQAYVFMVLSCLYVKDLYVAH